MRVKEMEKAARIRKEVIAKEEEASLIAGQLTCLVHTPGRVKTAIATFQTKAIRKRTGQIGYTKKQRERNKYPKYIGTLGLRIGHFTKLITTIIRGQQHYQKEFHPNERIESKTSSCGKIMHLED
ncbi:hypothetical protein HDV00_009968 [Rhizophlyctis rosea]|nr:hypothetical protein HDV00_009968 [Rhizophlyctis rosea]